MTPVRYDLDLLSPELCETLARYGEGGEARSAKKWAHINAAFAGCIEAIQQTMRPGTSQTSGGVQCSDVTDRTFAAVASRERGRAKLQEIARLSAEIDDLTRKLELAVTSQRREADAVTLAQVKDAARCSGMSLPGYPVWGNPTCGENAVDPRHSPLCGPCSVQERLWLSQGQTYVQRPSDGRRGARPKWDALMAASATNLRAGLEQIIEATG